MIELIRMAAHKVCELRPPRFQEPSSADGHHPWNASSGRLWWHSYRCHQADEVLHEGENPDAQQHEDACHNADAPAYLFHRAAPPRRHRSATQAHGLAPGSAMKRAAIEAGDHRADGRAAEGAAGDRHRIGENSHCRSSADQGCGGSMLGGSTRCVPARRCDIGRHESTKGAQV